MSGTDSLPDMSMLDLGLKLATAGIICDLGAVYTRLWVMIFQ